MESVQHSNPSGAIDSWVKQYTKAADKQMEDHKADVGVGSRRDAGEGRRREVLELERHAKSRYILASHLSKSRGAREARAVLLKAAANAASGPKEVRTDRLKSYISAVGVLRCIRAEVNNNLLIQGTFRQREKTLRLDSKESGQLYLGLGADRTTYSATSESAVGPVG